MHGKVHRAASYRTRARDMHFIRSFPSWHGYNAGELPSELYSVPTLHQQCLRMYNHVGNPGQNPIHIATG